MNIERNIETKREFSKEEEYEERLRKGNKWEE
jgi:hypothetical protein